MASPPEKQSPQSNHLDPTHAAAQEPFMATVRELVRAYQAFSMYTEKHIRQFGLTPAQFDVIATLGNTSGMNMSELAKRTLVTKGTLTGIVDRLEQKNLVRRDVPIGNRRSFIIALTPEGEAIFREVFPAQIAHIKERIERLPPEELETLHQMLKKLRDAFS